MSFVGIDVGTSGVKVLRVAEDGNILAKTTVEYPTCSPQPMWSEQDPDDWWHAVCKGLRHILDGAEGGGDAVKAVSFSGQMVGLVVLDKDGEVIRPCILWNDQRSAAVTEELTEQIGRDAILRETSNPLFASFVAPKLVWMRQHEPDKFARIQHVLLPKDYIVYKLTGRFTTEASDASGTCVFNVAERRWSEFMLQQMDLPAAWFPECVESEDQVGEVTADAACPCGLPSGTPVIAGGGDQPVQAIGSGIVRPGRCAVTIGTSGVIFAQGQRHLKHPQGLLHGFCHSVRGEWYLMGVMLSAGGALQWLRNTLRQIGKIDYTELDRLAGTVPLGSEGLVFLPYLTGERCPYDDPHARGGWIGLTARHGTAHLARSVIEGITFGLCDSLDSMRDVGLEIDEVYASGGAVKSPFWLQMLADVFGLPVITTNAAEGGAFGAAMLAAAGTRRGGVTDVSEQWIQQTDLLSPDAGRHRAYAEMRALYAGLYPALKDSFRALSAAAQREGP